MTEQDLILALRELIAKASVDSPDPRLLAREINRSDQVRVRWLAGLSILFWLLAAAGLVLLCIGLDRFIIYVRIMDYYPAVQPSNTNKAGPVVSHFSPLSERDRQMLHGTTLIHHTIWIVAGSIGALFLGALCTVLLVTTSRRATLRQINLSLMDLSEQVRQLRSANPLEKIRKPENS